MTWLSSVLQAVAGDQKRHAAGGIDSGSRGCGRAGLGLDDLDAVFEALSMTTMRARRA